MEKIIRLQDAKYKHIPNNNNETSVFIEQHIARHLGLEDGSEHVFKINKENILKSLSFTYSINKTLFKKDDIVIFDYQWFKDEYDLIIQHFELNNNYIVTVNKASGDRFYFKSLKQRSGFNIRNILIQDHFKFVFSELDNELTLEYSQTPFPITNKVEERSYFTDKPKNKILYGAPGTGKSFKLKTEAESLNFTEITRVTFHPNYSYQQFVGSYKPTPIYKNILEDTIVLYGSDKTTELENNQKREPLIDYTFVPGPFLTLLVKSLQNSEENYLLIIEEINRAPVSSVFGDVFQLLDRDETGESEYSITFNEEARSFLREYGIMQKEIKIPSNLFIWSTMNSADQGVMPLDAAFKRRWTFEYLPLDENEDQIKDQTIFYQGGEYNWNKFRREINSKLKSLGIAEDKLIGPFFLNKTECQNKDVIKNKLLLYLRDDVMRHDPKMIFKKDTFSDIVKDYDENKEIFVSIDFGSPLNNPDQELQE